MRPSRIIWKIFSVYVIFCVVIILLEPAINRKRHGEIPDAVSDIAMSERIADERVLCLDDNVDALVKRLCIIENAREEIAMTTFDITGDESGKDIISALCNAADRGVRVRMIVDGISGMIDFMTNGELKAFCAYKGVEVKIYNPINLLKPWSWGYRMHEKYLIADDFAYILGGRNTSDLFLGETEKRANIDRDILVYEADRQADNSLKTVKNRFDAMWNEDFCKTFKGKKDDELMMSLKGRYMLLLDKYMDKIESFSPQRDMIKAEKIAVLASSYEPKSKSPDILAGLGHLMDEKDEVLIESPYIICDKNMYGVLKRQNSVVVMTNAVESGANPFGCADYLMSKDKVLSTGADVCEVLAGSSLHNKTFIIGDDINAIGSYNFDMRSNYICTEIMVVVESRELNRRLRDSFEQKMHYGKLVNDNTEQYGDNYTCKELSFDKKLVYGILRFLMPGFRHLL